MSGRRATGRRRRIAVVTGSRAEYGLLKSTLTAISRHAALELQLVVTGMHLLEKFGRTMDEVAADGWRIDAAIPMQTGDDDPLDQARAVARGVEGMARYFQEAQADIVLVVGDRVEAMAAALAGVLTHRFVAHIHGGDVAPGDCDDSLRHAVTKLAHIHLPATGDAKRRIIRMGECRENVYVVGAPGLDRLGEIVAAHGGVTPLRERPPLAVVVQHPCGRAPAEERRVMASALRAVRDAGLSAWVVYPNSDAGHSGIIDAIERAAGSRRNGELHVIQSAPRDIFLEQLLRARVLVGNSSAGIIEAATAGTPTVNIGPRQAGRLRSGPTVLDCAESYSAIKATVRRAMRYRFSPRRQSVYGAGRAGERIAEVLASVRLDEHLRRKRIAY